MKKTTAAALMLILPGMAAFLFFNLWPIVYSIYLAFTNAQLGNFPIYNPQSAVEPMHFVGLENFKWALSDDKFINAFKWTWIFVFTSVTLKALAGLFLSLLYNSKYVKGKAIYRSLLIIPWALPLLFSVTVWKFMFDPVFGPINLVLKSIGITGPDWVNNPTWGFVALNIIEVWLAYPFMMTVITAALQSVPDTLIEAAIIDGANYWQRIWNVVVPIVGKPIAFATILTSAASFQYFMVPYIYNAGLFEDRFLLLYGFRKAFGASPHYGRAAAIMVIATLILAVYMYVNVRITRLQEGARG
ncbi:ABC-type maltodextrin transport system, permease component [Thermococcus kodakarensis KOD1]|uniref:ABC-type maltodextrin transport system, permease component n=1 Tax=Thermococcus kodakarensis (strain ATCC BAA-918 / JCM 12380 / KOD1) TaxID=69014 RepID=Q5JJ57_THEKO|nr:sugar ABC transporter permease [Thermococcus kodakarensis]WCN27684.1 sugar ABC transporter permease [Thermococcus kodakarensis]WCN29976.1 sugar ABC transporter permease [Thermococcus kodakarensis]BAD85961.1 ABC-type maltodextrin transport system, permease component [Thermococcus kodakarensis KOD1]